MKIIKAYAAQSPTTPLLPTTVPGRATTENDVVIDILFCGVCHSDLHAARGNGRGSVILLCQAMRSLAVLPPLVPQ